MQIENKYHIYKAFDMFYYPCILENKIVEKERELVRENPKK